MPLHRVLGAVGRTLIATGVLILLFVAYQLWGTGIQEARAQAGLRSEFFERLDGYADEYAASYGQNVAEARRRAAREAPPPPPEGEALAVMKIPRLDVEKTVVEGVGVGDLKRGPGHYPGTPAPGQPGNVAIAGHRTTYGAPFGDLDLLEPGDRILVTTLQGEFEYHVRESLVVRPEQTEVLDDFGDNRLTLTTCHPRFSAAKRLVVIADLAGEAAPAPDPSELTEAPDLGELPTEEVDDLASELEQASLSGDPAARGPALAWGTGAGMVWLLAWVAGRRWKRWPAYLLGTPLFLVVLFFFFENFARLLPANI